MIEWLSFSSHSLFSWDQFNQRFTNCFFAVILTQKNTNTNCIYRRSAQNTFAQENLLAKCWWNFTYVSVCKNLYNVHQKSIHLQTAKMDVNCWLNCPLFSLLELSLLFSLIWKYSFSICFNPKKIHYKLFRLNKVLK